ncbi:hypothetical protein HYW44_02440 [Candidatus Daviesbacteria bacterium]|nr:hypothetical protein [Candidatus Daviesbacteria bacterium]
MTKPEDGENIGRLMVDAHARLVKNDKRFMQVTPVDQLSGWFLKSFATDNFYPVHMCDDPSAPIQLRGLYLDLDPEVQLKMRTALVDAVCSWRPEEHGNRALSEMAFTTSDIRAAEAVMHFIRVVDDRQIIGDPEDEATSHTWRSVIGVVGGFAPSDEIKEATRRWFYDPTFPPRSMAQVLTALTICAPEEYPAHVTRFLEVEREHPSFYHLKVVLGNVIKHAGVPTVAEHLHELTPDPLITFARALIKDVYKMAEVTENPLGIRDRINGNFYAFKATTPEQTVLLQSTIRQILTESIGGN